MWEAIIDSVTILVLVILYCIFHRKVIYGGTDNSQTRWDDGHPGIGHGDQGHNELSHP